MNEPQHRPAARPVTRGPIALALFLVIGLCFIAFTAWCVGILVEALGGYFLPDILGIQHAQRMVEQDMGYIAAAPRSIIINDTVAFGNWVTEIVRVPFDWVGATRWYARWHGSEVQDTAAKLDQSKHDAVRAASSVALTAMLVAQDVLLRLSVALFALPAFALACLLGVLDGMVRRDLRRWSGGRESSFLYHHAKNYSKRALTAGFALYLAWPFGGFNPAYMVLVFTALVAATLSTTVASFKKYL